MYLVTGGVLASGRVSDSVVALLRGSGERVRVMVRRNDVRANWFRDLGAEVMVADLTSPADVVDAMREVAGAALQRIALAVDIDPHSERRVGVAELSRDHHDRHALQCIDLPPRARVGGAFR